jgi:hypothetical protein
MDNMCQNVLTVTCSNTKSGRNSLRNFLADNTLSDGSLSLNKKIPQPNCPEYREFYWGCASDIESGFQIFTEKTPIRLRFYFDTDILPCDQWVMRISNIYLSLSFELIYGNYLGDYSGLLKLTSGNIVSNECDDYLSYAPRNCVNCPECNDYIYFEFEDEYDPKRAECRHLIEHINEYNHCFQCSTKLFQKVLSRKRIENFINRNINHRLYRFPDGLRLPFLQENFINYCEREKK